MTKKAATLIVSLLMLSLLSSFQAPAASSDGVISVNAQQSGETQAVSLPSLLREFGMSFDEYMALFSTLESYGISPHCIDDNAVRYAWFMRYFPDIPKSAAMAYVNIGVDVGFYNRIKEVGDPDSVTLLVNKNHMLPEGWAPSNLTYLDNRWPLNSDAADALALMRSDMAQEGLNLQIVSTYRAYSRQARSHRQVELSSGLEQADLQLARPGHSEHQTGLAIDILHRPHSGKLSNANFQDTDEFAWLTANAYRYGFILRYPEGETGIHGYMFEPWHWRYVGADVARAMQSEGIAVYEEFYGKYLAPDVLRNVRQALVDLQSAGEFLSGFGR